MFTQDKNLPPAFFANDFDEIQASTQLTPMLFKGFWGDLFDSLPEGVLILDHARKMLLMNKKIKQLWGYSTSVKTGQEALALIIDKVENPVGFQARIEEIIADIHCESQEVIKLKNGQIYQRNTQPLIIGGKNLGRFWTYRDITYEYNIERALRESEAQYRILYDAGQRLMQRQALLDQVRATVASDLDLSVLFQNIVQSISDAFGYTLVSLYLLDGEKLFLQHQVGYNQVIEGIPINSGVSGKVVISGKPILIEDVSKDPNFLAAIDGIVSEICVPLFDNDQVVGTLNIESVDGVRLTESDLELAIALSELISPAISRAHLYTEIKTQEQQLKSIFDLAPIGFILCALDGTFVQVNKAFENTVGYTENELLGLKFIDITHPEERANNLKWVTRLIAGEISTYGFEKRYIHKDGSFINAYLQVSLLPTQSNRPARLIAQVVDLTDSKKAENALLQHQKMESIGVLAGGIAHDFNNLLVALKAQSSLALLKLAPDSEAKQHIEKMVLAANSAAQLTEQLLAYSGQGKFSVTQLDVNDEVYKNIQLIGSTIPENVKLVHQFTPNLRQIMGDNIQIQQILMNIIINGVESMGGQAGTVTILTEEVEVYPEDMDITSFALKPPAPGQFIAISIIDTGVGLNEETMKKIFDPFYTTKFTGRGLGLAAVLGIVRSHNGALCVKSTVGKGSKFKIYFPVAADQASIKHKMEPALNAPSVKSTVNGSDEKQASQMVLVIDDDKLVTETIVDLFELEDISTICAANGSEGIEQMKANKDRVALILLDLSMPGISSEETFTNLRNINPNVPILLCSGFSELKVSEYFADKEYEGFIAKPFDIHKLIKTIRKFI